MEESSDHADAPPVLDPNYGTCTALSLQSTQKCESPAVVPQPPFCDFHKQQCRALYVGYKCRSAELTALESSPPAVLPRNMGNNDFSSISDVGVLTAIYEYLRKKYNLVSRCVLAREVHHQHFYKDTSDFGHQAYLDKLKTARALLTSVLGRLERRMLQVKYAQEEWYAWVRKLQEEEEERAVVEKKRIKAAADLERKHQARISTLKAQEEAKHREKLENEEVWDPIEFTVSGIRVGYIALIRAILNDKDLADSDKAAAKERANEIGASLPKGGGLGKVTGSREELLEMVRAERKRTKNDFVTFGEGEDHGLTDDLDSQLPFGKTLPHTQVNEPTRKVLEEKLAALRANKQKASSVVKAKKSGKKGRKAGKNKGKKATQSTDADGEEEEKDVEEITGDGGGAEGEEEETEEALVSMLQMLKTGRPENVDLEKLVIPPDFSLMTMKDGKPTRKGPDTDETPEQAASPYREITTAVRHLWHFVDEIKPRFYDVDYPVEEDLKKAPQKLLEQTRAIRQYQILRLVLNNPSLLCVALECESIEQFLNDTDRVRNTDLRDLALGMTKTTMQDVRNACSDYWLNEALKGHRNGDGSATAKDMGKAKENASKEEKLKRVRVCGQWLHHYPKESRLPRRGWFQFGLLTFASYSTALSLCQSWDEAFELSILSMHGYFSALPQSWAGMNEPDIIRDARRIGFLTYARSGRADKATSVLPIPGGAQMVNEARNYICGNMSRQDPRARRFVKMLEATSSELRIWVKDCRTGKVIYKPPSEERWIVRTKTVGAKSRSTSKEWKVLQAMDSKFREQIGATRPWKLAFPDYLEVHIWDAHAGRHFMDMMSVIMKLLNKAYFLADQISSLCSTLDVFQRIAIEEGGPDGEHALRAKEIRRNLKKLRKREEFKAQLLSPNPDMWYGELDEYLDKKCKPWHERYWSTADEDERSPALQAGLAEIKGKIGEMNDSEQLAWMMKDVMQKIFVEDAMQGKKMLQQFDDSDSDDDEVGEADDSSDWEDEDTVSRHEEIWEEAEGKAEVLEETADVLSEDLYEMSLMMTPGFDKKKYEAGRREIGRSITTDLNKTLSPKDRLREARRLKQVTQMPVVIPANFWFCHNMVQMIMSSSLKDIEMYEMWKQNEADVEWSRFALLRNNDLRAKNLPPRRSNAIPKNVIDDWEKHMKHWELGKPSNERLADPKLHMPKEWIEAIMERIVLLWKRGFIVPSYNTACMPVFSGREEPNGPLHFYCDFRAYLQSGMVKAASHTPEGLRVRPPKGPDQLKREMEKWEARNPNSTYSLLKMKSELECWPFDMPDETRSLGTILDPTGRIWEFEKMPKDFPLADVDMHMRMALLMLEAPDFEGNSTEEDKISYWVKHRVDVFLVCGRTLEECKKWTTKAAAYFRKKPRGFDIDWARSYYGVKADWLRNVPEKVWL